MPYGKYQAHSSEKNEQINHRPCTADSLVAEKRINEVQKSQMIPSAMEKRYIRNRWMGGGCKVSLEKKMALE